MMVGVGGCVAQQEGEKIVKRSAAVDFVFGTHNLSLVPSLIQRRSEGLKPQVAVDYRDEWEDLPAGFAEGGKVSAFVSISRGCNKNCSYCIVPVTRGAEVSRSPEEIEREARIAIHRGAKEIVLLGQTVNSYGLDFSPRVSFINLIERLSRIEGLKRIRFTSPHPQEVRKDFIDLVCDNPKVCRHIHMPLQSGSDRMLKAMNRNYRRRRYLDIIEAIYSRVPDMSVTTDLIVGFPGESDADFEETLDAIRQVRYDNSYSFMYSPRPGTPAATMPDQIPHEVKLERLKILQTLQFDITQDRLTSWIGKRAEVLIEGPSHSDPEKLFGRSSQNITVNMTEAHSQLQAGEIVDVTIVGHAKFTLKAELPKDAMARSEAAA